MVIAVTFFLLWPAKDSLAGIAKIVGGRIVVNREPNTVKGINYEPDIFESIPLVEDTGDTKTTPDKGESLTDEERAADGALLFQSAEEDCKAQRWEDAMEKYEAITQISPPYASKAHIQRGKYYKYRGFWSEALEEFEAATATAFEIRDLEDAQTSIGAVYLSKGDYQTALSIFNEIIAKTDDWQQVKYCSYWIKELMRRMEFGEEAGCSTCGPNALKELFKLKGVELSDKELERIPRLAKGGASMEDLRQFARSKGLTVHGARLSMAQLEKIAKPLIALIEDPQHYIIVTAFDPKGIRIIDPEYSREPYYVGERAFGKVWKGYTLVFSEVKSEMITARLSTNEMKNLKGKVCYCCPPGNNGTEVPNTDFERDCVGSAIIVNTMNLNMMFQDTDLYYRGRGPHIAIMRTYNADDFQDGPFGHSWTFNYNVKLNDVGTNIDVTRETGTVHRFTNAGGGNYTPPSGVYDTLIKNPDGTYTLKLKGGRLTQHFNSSGKLTSITDKNGNSVSLTYSDGRLTTITDAADRHTTLNYGPNGKISAIVDPSGRSATYTYDASNNLISSTGMDGTTHSYGYDSSSYLTAITTPKGTTTITYSTSSGHVLATITDPMGHVKSYGYHNGYHNIIEITNANGKKTLYESNAAGYTTKITDPLNNIITYEYTNGNRTRIIDANGHTISLTYNTGGDITSISDPLGHAAQFSYLNDNLTQFVDAAENVYGYEYDPNNNLAKIKYPDYPANGETNFAYNSYDELTTLTDARGNAYNFGYDNYGNHIESYINDHAGGTQDTYEYDTVGRVISHTDRNGSMISYGYDGIDRLTSVTYPNSSSGYTYDCCGLSTASNVNGTVSFTYDNARRPTSVTDVYGKMISYGYDNAGNLTSVTYPGNKVVTYGYDDADRLITVTDWLNNVTSYEYDAAGNLIKTTYPNGSTIIHQYDDANRLIALTDYKTADLTVNAFFNYTLDALGNREEISFYQPLDVMPSPQALNCTYGFDNRINTAGSTTYTSDANGNLISKTGGSPATYTWNYNNMLTDVAVSGGNTYHYKYDGLGNRVAMIDNNEVETRYIVDPLGSRVLAETNEGGTITAYYVYGLGLISKITPTGQTYYYHYDGLGSTIAITNTAGTIVNKYAYDTYGKVLSQTEAIPNPFKYVGKFGVMDDGNGLLYMRARYYDTAVGRFISKDPIGFAGGDLNLYAYVGNNPIRYMDPKGTGKCEDELNESMSRAVANAPECLKNVGEYATLCAISGPVMCLAFGPEYSACVAAWEAACGAGGLGGIMYCHVMEVGEVAANWFNYYKCKQDEKKKTCK
jgi:RHS repeat-associated protein